MTDNRSKAVALAMLSLALCAFSGCATTSAWTMVAKPWKKHHPPTRMVLMVTPSPVEGPGFKVHNGLICRAYFFAGKDAEPVQLKGGDIVFTAYDRSNPDPQQPDGLYEIPESDMPKHLRKDIVGDSYVFWLPFNSDAASHVLVQGELKLPNGEVITSSAVSVELNSQSPLHGFSQSERKSSYLRTYQERIQPKLPQNMSAN